MNNKIAFISDIHGNYEALKVVLDYLDINKINTIYSLGDVVGYYCQVNEVCESYKKEIYQIFLVIMIGILLVAANAQDLKVQII